jgi:hypothetical protein
VVDRLHEHGFETFWVDLTKPEIGVPVTVAFVPGLQDQAHG